MSQPTPRTQRALRRQQRAMDRLAEVRVRQVRFSEPLEIPASGSNAPVPFNGRHGRPQAPNTTITLDPPPSSSAPASAAAASAGRRSRPQAPTTTITLVNPAAEIDWASLVLRDQEKAKVILFGQLLVNFEHGEFN